MSYSSTQDVDRDGLSSENTLHRDAKLWKGVGGLSRGVEGLQNRPPSTRPSPQREGIYVLQFAFLTPEPGVPP